MARKKKLISKKRVGISQAIVDQFKKGKLTKYIQSIAQDLKIVGQEVHFNKYQTVLLKTVKSDLTLDQLEILKDPSKEIDLNYYDVTEEKMDNWLIVPDENIAKELVKDTHVAHGHCGRDTCLEVLSAKYYIPNFKKVFSDVKDGCETCLALEVPRVVVPHPHYKLSRVGEMIFTDCAFFPKCRNVFGWVAFIDGFSKFTWSFLLYNKSTETIKGHAQTVLQWLAQRNISESSVKFVSDNGGEFKSHVHVIDSFTEQTGCKWHYVPAGRPQANGLIERWNATIKSLLRSLMKERQSQAWIIFFDECVGIYNNRPHTSTNEIPAFVLNCLAPLIGSEETHAQAFLEQRLLTKRIQEAQEKKNLKNEQALIKRAAKGGFQIASSIHIGCAVLVAPPAKFVTQERGFVRKAIVEKNCGNGFYVIKFLETGGYRNTELPLWIPA